MCCYATNFTIQGYPAKRALSAMRKQSIIAIQQATLRTVSINILSWCGDSYHEDETVVKQFCLFNGNVCIDNSSFLNCPHWWKVTQKRMNKIRLLINPSYCFGYWVLRERRQNIRVGRFHTLCALQFGHIFVGFVFCGYIRTICRVISFICQYYSVLLHW